MTTTPNHTTSLAHFFTKYIHWFSYLLTGIFSTIMQQILSYQGLSEPTTLILPMLNYIGMFSVAFLPDICFQSSSNQAPSPPPSSFSPQQKKRFPIDIDETKIVDNDVPNPNEETSTVHPRTASQSDPDLEATSPLLSGSTNNNDFSPTTHRHNVHKNKNNYSVLSIDRSVQLMICGDLVGTYFSLAGLMMAGSGIYSSIHSSIVLWAALLSVIFLKKKLPMRAWASLCLIIFGLVFSCLAQADHDISPAFSPLSQSVSQPPIIFSTSTSTTPFHRPTVSSFWSDKANSLMSWLDTPQPTPSNSTQRLLFGGKSLSNNAELHNTFVGIFLSLVGALCWGMNYVLAETIQKNPGAPKGRELAERCGASATFVCGIYMLLYTFPKWHELVTETILERNGDNNVIMLCAGMLLVSQSIHAVNYFNLVKTAGAVSVGVLNSFRAISTFAVSAYLFCDKQSSQCFTANRGISACIVSAGILLYSFTKSGKQAMN